MSRKTWTLTDVATDAYLDRLSVGPNDVGGEAEGYRVIKRTLRGGLRDGVDVVEVDNGRMRFVLVPTRGMGIWRAECDRLRLGWHSPVAGPVNPAFVPLWEPSGIGWLGGFDEMLVRCGLESNGAPEFRPDGALQWPLHGKIANTPAHKLELAIDGQSGEIAVRGTVVEARLFGGKLQLVSTVVTKVGQPWLSVADEITNLSAEPGEMELLYHVNFGRPLVAPGSAVRLPIGKMAPRDAAAAAELDRWNLCDPETPGAPEVCFFFDPAAEEAGKTQALLRAADGERGVSLKFNKRQFPCFILWKNRQAAADGYVTGLEPAINFPNPRSFEKQQGRVAALAPGESRRFELTVQAHTDADAVATAERAIGKIQESVSAEICREPNPDWSTT